MNQPEKEKLYQEWLSKQDYWIKIIEFAHRRYFKKAFFGAIDEMEKEMQCYPDDKK
jgi:hypothetical protein